MVNETAMPDDLVEPRHPSGRELRELERCLFCLYLVAVEAKHFAAVFFGHEDRKSNGSLVFTVMNHAVIVIDKFVEAWDTFNGLAKSDDRVKKLCAAVRPLIRRLRAWPQLRAYRSQAMAHPFRDSKGRVIHPTAFVRAGVAPAASDECMQLTILARLAATAALAYFEPDFEGIRPLLEEYPEQPKDSRAMTADARQAELQSLATRVNQAIEELGIDLAGPIFQIFS